jgi:broad specificity phosphatase PhoE
MDATKRPLRIIFIRHAESERNKAKKGATYFADEEARKTVRGIPDHKITLTPEGMIQAQKTGIYLKNKFGAPDYCYHSGYRRTEQTLEEILRAFPADESVKIKIRMNQFIRERDPGYAYDMTTEEAEAAFPWLHDHWQTFGGFLCRPPGGESLSDVSQRAYTFINMLFRDRNGKNIWVVTHGGTLRAIRFILERWTYDQALKWPRGQAPENCGITVYEFNEPDKRPVLVEYNAVAWR